MGLFDSIKKVGLEKIVNTIEDKLDDVTGGITDRTNGYEDNGGYSAPYNPAPQSTVYEAAPLYNMETAVPKFEQIFATEFSDFQIAREASPESVGIAAPAQCRNYSYALWRDGLPVIVIMLTPHNRDNNAAFLNAKAAAQNSRVKFLNFYTHFPNERDYVISRIRSAL